LLQQFRSAQRPLTMGELVDRFRQEEQIDRILAQETGEVSAGELAYSTALSYSTYLERYIRPRWGKIRLNEIVRWRSKNEGSHPLPAVPPLR
jgi:hypothetical protein